MVSKTVFLSVVLVAVILMTAAAKPTNDEEREYNSYEADDRLSADSPRAPPILRINRHGKRGFVDGQDNYEEPENVAYDTRGMLLEDGPPRLRMNRHGK